MGICTSTLLLRRTLHTSWDSATATKNPKLLVISLYKPLGGIHRTHEINPLSLPLGISHRIVSILLHTYNMQQGLGTGHTVVVPWKTWQRIHNFWLSGQNLPNRAPIPNYFFAHKNMSCPNVSPRLLHGRLVLVPNPLHVLFACLLKFSPIYRLLNVHAQFVKIGEALFRSAGRDEHFNRP